MLPKLITTLFHCLDFTVSKKDFLCVEGSAGMDTWNAPTVQSRQPLTYRLLESVGLGGLRWLESS